MALVIEDGTGVPGAESYATALEFDARARAYGWKVPFDYDEQEVLLRRAFEAMNAMRWKGCKSHPGQAGAFPRSGAVVDGEHVPDDHIPAAIQYGQMALAAEIYADDLSPPETQKGAVIREKVDVIEVQYANPGKVMRAAPERPSSVQFSDYLERRGLYVAAVRA